MSWFLFLLISGIADRAYSFFLIAVVGSSITRPFYCWKRVTGPSPVYPVYRISKTSFYYLM